MKNGALLAAGLAALLTCAVAASPSWSLDWHIPVTTLHYEVASGSSEDSDEGILLPSSIRNTVTLRFREEAAPDAFGLTVKGSWKDYFDQSGDYAYVEAEHDGSLRFADWVKLGYTIGAKDLTYPQPDSEGLSKDSLSLKSGLSATFTVVKGTSVEAGVSGRFELATNEARSLQAYVATAAFSSRIGEWVFGARYRGEFRLPLGSASGVTSNMYHTGGISFEWDPNR